MSLGEPRPSPFLHLQVASGFGLHCRPPCTHAPAFSGAAKRNPKLPTCGHPWRAPMFHRRDAWVMLIAPPNAPASTGAPGAGGPLPPPGHPVTMATAERRVPRWKGCARLCPSGRAPPCPSPTGRRPSRPRLGGAAAPPPWTLLLRGGSSPLGIPAPPMQRTQFLPAKVQYSARGCKLPLHIQSAVSARLSTAPRVPKAEREAY